MQNHLNTLLRTVYEKLQSEAFKETYRMQSRDFTRNRKLGFFEIMLLILRSSKKSLHTSIDTFLKEVRCGVDSYSKAAFCKARQKIHPDAFKALFTLTVEQFYKEVPYKRYRGYRLLAIDGTDLNLPNTPELLELYGSESFFNGPQVQSQCSCLYDVLNHVILDGIMDVHNASERTLALTQLEKLGKGDLLLLDRGYPSEQLMLAMEEKGIQYLMRCNKKEFFREVRKVTVPDAVVTRKSKEKELTFRVLTVAPEGKEETLLTNIMGEDFTVEDFQHLYGLRWGIETKYNDLKNKLQLENYSGVNAICIQQDFYATLFLSNAMAFLEADYAKEIEKLNASEKKKYEYQLNRARTIELLRNSFVELVVTDSRRKQKKLYNHIQKQLQQSLLPIREGRTFPRHKKHPALKFPSNA